MITPKTVKVKKLWRFFIYLWFVMVLHNVSEIIMTSLDIKTYL